MFDYYDRCTVFNQAIDDAKQCFNVKRVQSDRGFVKDEDRIALSARHFARKL